MLSCSNVRGGRLRVSLIWGRKFGRTGKKYSNRSRLCAYAQGRNLNNRFSLDFLRPTGCAISTASSEQQTLSLPPLPPSIPIDPFNHAFENLRARNHRHRSHLSMGQVVRVHSKKMDPSPLVVRLHSKKKDPSRPRTLQKGGSPFHPAPSPLLFSPPFAIEHQLFDSFGDDHLGLSRLYFVVRHRFRLERAV